VLDTDGGAPTDSVAVPVAEDEEERVCVLE